MEHTNPLQSDEKMSTQEVADLLGIVPRTLHRWIESGHFPAPFRLGGSKNSKMKWKRSAVEAWISGKEDQS